MSNTTTKERVDPEVVKVASVLIVGALAVVFDTTIVSVALRTLATELHTTVTTIQWVSTGYLLALGVTVPLAGWAQARFGGKRTWMVALTLFLLGSVLCSLAWDAPSLITFRVIQGVGGGLMLPLLQTLIMQAASGKNLGRTMSIVSLPTALGPILGPVIGGIILNWLDWRWLFRVNVPFCVVGLFLAWRFLPKDAASSKPKLDVIGLVLLSPSLVGILYGLSNVTKTGGFGRAVVLIPLLAGVVLLAAFAVYSIRMKGRALVDVRLLSRRPVASGTVLMFLSGGALYGAMLLLPLYFQEIRGATPLVAGLFLVPQGVGTLFSRTLAGRLTDSIGARWVAVVGFAIVAIATIPFAFATPTTNEWYLMGALFVRGFGMGAVFIPIMTAAFVGLERTDVPHASILTRISQQVGGSFGVALLAVILEGAVASYAVPTLTNVAMAFNQAFWWCVGLSALAIIVALALPTAAKKAKGVSLATSDERDATVENRQ